MRHNEPYAGIMASMTAGGRDVRRGLPEDGICLRGARIWFPRGRDARRVGRTPARRGRLHAVQSHGRGRARPWGRLWHCGTNTRSRMPVSPWHGSGPCAACASMPRPDGRDACPAYGDNTLSAFCRLCSSAGNTRRCNAGTDVAGHPASARGARIASTSAIRRTRRAFYGIFGGACTGLWLVAYCRWLVCPTLGM